MDKIKEFTDLEVWRESRELVSNIYKITVSYPQDEKYNLVSQIRRAVLSISANIAEGFGRYHYKDRLIFYYNSRGSLKEVQNFIIISRDLSYIRKDFFDMLWMKCKNIDVLLGGLIKETRKLS